MRVARCHCVSRPTGKIVILGIAAYSLGLLLILIKGTTFSVNQVFPNLFSFNYSRDITESGTLSVDVVRLARSMRLHRKQAELQSGSGSDVNMYVNGRHLVGQKARNQTQFAAKHFMTISEGRGRMGNQLFQFAMLLGTASRYGYTPIVSGQFPLLQYFDIPQVRNLTLKRSRRFLEKRSGVYHKAIEALTTTTNWTFDGFFQSWKYFSQARDVIVSSLKFKPKIIDPAQEFISNHSRAGRQNICVHVRRGDIISQSSAQRGYSAAGVQYLRHAMTHFRRKYSAILFIMVSEDMTWCETHVRGSDVIYSPFYRSGTDMALISLCDHVIMTSGTFGWWGAWLSGGDVVYYKDFPRPGSWLSTQINTEDYYLPSWTGIV